MTSDELVSNLRSRRETGNLIITPGQPSTRKSISERAIDGFRRKKSFAVWFDESDGALEPFDGNFWKSVRRFLISFVINFARGDFAPPLDPAFAKMTFAIPNHEWLGRWVADAEMRLRVHCFIVDGGP